MLFQRALTTEFIDATKVNEVEKLKNQGFSLADVDKKLVVAFSEQIFHTGFVHADPHPGNGKGSFNIIIVTVDIRFPDSVPPVSSFQFPFIL